MVPGQRAEAEAHAERGAELAHAGNLDSAVTELRQAAKLAPANPDVLASLGTVLAMQRKLEESSDVFRKELKIRPGDWTSRRYLAANLWQLHQYREAKENLQIILKQKPGEKDAELLLGMVSENMGDYATAARMLGSVPDEVAKQPESVAALARSYYHLGETEKARATLARMSATENPQAVFLGGQIADEMGDYPTAQKLLASIRATFPDQRKVDYTRALVEYHAGRFDQSQQILQDLMASGNKTAEEFNLLGWCYEKQGRHAEAVQALENSIELAPQDQANYLDLSKVLVAQHSLPAALKNATRTAEAFPNSASAFEMRGFVEAGMGQYTDAIRSYSRAAQLDPARPDGVLGLAQAQFAAGLGKDASANFESGIKKFPKDARLQTQYAVMLLKQAEIGDAAAQVRAEQILRSAVQLDPLLPEVHYQLGNIALQKNRLEEAQHQLEQAVKLDAQSGAAHFALARAYRRLDRKGDAAREMKIYENLASTDSHPQSPTEPGAEPRE